MSVADTVKGAMEHIIKELHDDNAKNDLLSKWFYSAVKVNPEGFKDWIHDWHWSDQIDQREALKILVQAVKDRKKKKPIGFK